MSPTSFTRSAARGALLLALIGSSCADPSGSGDDVAAASLVISPEPAIVGWVDGVARRPSPPVGYALGGWACRAGLSASIPVRVIAGGPIGQGTELGVFTADRPSEPAVAAHCQTSYTAYRFDIALAPAVLRAHAGQPLFVYGEHGGLRALLPGTGGVAVPTSEVIGHIDEIARVGPAYRARGWACERGFNLPIAVHLYARARAGQGGTIIGSAQADLPSEPAVSQACQTSGVDHRFDVQLDPQAVAQHAGMKLFIHGIANTGHHNLVLTRSGDFAIPLTESGQVLLPTFSIPTTKHGLGDHLGHTPGLPQARFDRFEHDLSIDIQQFNVFWSGFEPDGMPSSATPMACPAGFTLVPRDAAEKAQYGYHRYRCIDTARVADFDAIFTRLRSMGTAISVVLWSAPAQYRDPGCEGFDNLGSRLYLGCVPMDAYEDDWDDWVRFVAVHYGDRVDHYVLWNEVQYNTWFDYSSAAFPKAGYPQAPQAYIARNRQKHTSMFSKAIRTIEERDTFAAARNMIYVSVGPYWDGAPLYTPATGHLTIAGKELVADLWTSVGLTRNWAVAYHAYGGSDPGHTVLWGFEAAKVVAAYQRGQIEARTTWPYLKLSQSRVFTNEQGQPVGSVAEIGNRDQAVFVCMAHDYVVETPEIVGVVHNHFQEPRFWPTPPIFGMLPRDAGLALEQADGYETYQAYRSTASHRWGMHDQHYCCQEWGRGCLRAGQSPTGQVTSRAGGTIAGWAYDPDQPWRSLAVKFYAGGVLVGAAVANQYLITLNVSAGISGNHRFVFPVPAGVDPATVVAKAVDSATPQEVALP